MDAAPYPDWLGEVLDAVGIVGAEVKVGSHARVATDTATLAPTATPAPLVATLQALLYEHAYCRRLGAVQAGVAPATPGPAVPSGADDLAARLAAANSSRERWEGGWEIVALLPSGQAMVGRDVRTRLAWPGEYVSEAVGTGAPQPGLRVSLRAPRGSATLQAGFYHAFGETLGNAADEDRLLRFYWHVEARSAPDLTAELTQALNRHAVPFSFKALSTPDAYPRTDAAVLYVARRYYAITALLAEQMQQRLAAGLRAEVPLFTRALAPGLGFAEDPGGSESFGWQRCRLVAQGLAAAHAAGQRTAAERAAAVATEFRRAGLDPAVPHLNSSHGDPYPFPSCR